jgi:uncharacterized protein with von Willebrand factor type A (vWA) domain
MQKKVTRPQLLTEAVTEVDEFTVLRYLQLREQTPRLLRVEENGGDILPNVQGGLLDLYYSLWAPEPTLKVKEEVPSANHYWRQMLESAMHTTAYGQMHAQTQLQELPSLLGTISMGQSLLDMISDEDREQLKQQAQTQAQANAAEQQMQQAQAQAQAAEQVLSQLQQALVGKPSEQTQQAMAQVQQQMQQAQAQAQAAQLTLEQAKARAEVLAQQLLGQEGSERAQQKQAELARTAQQAATNAAKEVKEVSTLLQSWGIDPGELTREGMPKALDLLARMRSSKEFQRFKDLLGRMRQIAERKARTNQQSEKGGIVKRTTYGRDITHAERSELVQLVAHPVTRVKTLERWARGELRLIQQKRKQRQKLGKGPIVVCEDGSSSMKGEKKLWSKAVCLALAYYARLEKRTFVWIHFGSKTSPLIVRAYPNGQLGPEQMLEIAETFLASGTDFEVPLSHAMEVIRKENLKKADVAMLTDGECAVSDAWLQSFLNEKGALEVNVISVLMDVGETSISTVQQFSDKVEIVSEFTAEEAGQKVMRQLVA